ncbi:unnamed protein product [Linum tenue]|uniref:Uncharacterized protein n=1 Tax=Linum tenue TaxID=586396 RepID=A0AAV0PP01_9ROSI|nr:unnamed protein product [Linum tenue]
MVASGSAGSLSQLLSFLKHAASDPLNSEPQVRMCNHESSSSDLRGEQQHEKKLHNVGQTPRKPHCWRPRRVAP